MTRKPDLIVPIHDRRRRKRILTLKNAQHVAIVTIVLFLAFTVISEVRDRRTANGYGRLLEKQVSVPAPQVQRTQEIVTEGTIADQDHADPMLLTAAAREQYLGVTSTANTASVVPVAQPEPVQPVTAIGDHVTVVGDSSGVTIVKTETQQRGVLGGGIFKQQ